MGDGTQVHAQESTTGISNDANAVVSMIAMPSRVDSLLTSSSSSNFIQDIKSFLGKPVVIQNGVFAATDTFGTFAGINVPGDILNNTIYSNKVMGYLGFKADTVFRLQVNGTRFQQGRYMLTFTYTGGVGPIVFKGASWITAHTNTLVQRTQLPRLEIDINCDTEGYFRIPFISIYNYFPLVAKGAQKYTGDIGQVRIFPYSALQVGAGSLNCSFTLWAHFENIELITPAAPQMARAVFGNNKKGRSDTEKEQNSQGVGPISSTFLTISKSAGILASVPLLSDYANAVSWVTEAMGKAASSFGWSKPVNLMATNRVQHTIVPYVGNIDTVDQSLPLSFSSKNEVEKLPGFSGTDVDEMSLNFIATIPAWFQTVVWSTGQIIGTALTEREVNPIRYSIPRTVNLQPILDYLPCAFVASHFSQWRGSMVFTFKLVKTEFHSGRLAVAYFPHTEGFTVTARSYTLSDYVHREIIDIREMSTFTVTIPFMSLTSYKSTSNTLNNAGTLCLYVVDPLIAPDNVPQTIPIIVEVACGPDIEFALPKVNYNVPTWNVTPQMADPFKDPAPQQNNCTIFESTLGASNGKEDSLINPAAAIGEKVVSFRSLLKMGQIIAPLGAFTTGLYYNILPWSTNVFWNAGILVSNSYTCDLLGRLTSCYALGRGGVRWKALNNGVASNIPLVAYPVYVDPGYTTSQVVNPSGTDVAGAVSVSERISVPNAYFHMGLNSGAEIQLPQYTSTHSRAGADMMVNPSHIYTTSQNEPRTLLSITAPGQLAPVSMTLMRAAADDFNLGCFVSIPPMSSLQTPSTITRV